MVTELINSPYPYDKSFDYVRFDYLLDRWDDTVANWNVLERILDQFAEDHNLTEIPVSWIFDDYNLDDDLVEGRITECQAILDANSEEWDHMLEFSKKDLIAVIGFMKWLLTVPEDIREFYHKVYEHDHDEWYLDSNKTGRLNTVTKAE